VFSLSSFGEACSPRRRPRQSLKLDVHIFVPPAGPNCFLNGPIVHGKANKLERRSVRQFIGGIAAGFSYLAGPENVNRQLGPSIH